MENKIKLTKTFEKNLDAYRSGFRFIINKGSSRSSKTFSILQLLYLISRYSEKKLIIHVVSYSTPHLRDGAITDFDAILSDAGEDLSRVKIKNPYTYTINSSVIKFIGFDKAGKALGAKRDILFINEANNLQWSVVDQLLMRTTDRVFIDYNPSQVFWLTEQGINTRENAITIHSTFLDNLENLTESQLTEFKEMKRKHDEEENNGIKGYWFNKWRVYGLGEEGIIEGMIFNNWSIGEFPNHLTSIYGIDWGVRDPFTLTEVAKNGTSLHVRQKVYKTGLTPNEVIDLIKKNVPQKALIIADNADTSMIIHCRNAGINIMPCLSKDKVVVGIFHLSNYDNIIITPESTDIINEFKNYVWLDKAGEVPIDKWNHCFVGSTLIETIEGPKRIDSIKEGDLVINSGGRKKVLKRFDNGLKPVNKYLLQFDTESIILEVTSNHKIKTTKGWKEISQLKAEDVVFLHKNLTGESTTNTKGRGTLLKALKNFIGLFGSSLMDRYLKVMIYTIKMAINQTMIYQILIWSNLYFIKDLKEKKGLKKIQNLLKNFKRKGLKHQKNGINQKKARNGIENTQSILDLEKTILKKRNANNVKKLLCQKPHILNSAQTIARANGGGLKDLTTSKELVRNAVQYSLSINIQKQKLVAIKILGQKNEQVYDLMIQDVHEYFANGLLVHNCIDGIRYVEKFIRLKNL